MQQNTHNAGFTGINMWMKAQGKKLRELWQNVWRLPELIDSQKEEGYMDSSPISTNAENHLNSKSGKELFKKTPIENTPFDIIENEETGKFYIFIGNQRINVLEINNRIDAIRYIERHKWEIITNVAIIAAETAVKMKNLK